MPYVPEQGRPQPDVSEVVKLIREAVKDHGRALVLCRSGSVRRGVLERLRDAGTGWYGVEVVTLEAAARQHAPNFVAPEGAAEPAEPAAFPADHEWGASLADRPKLRGELRRHVVRARALRELSNGQLPAAIKGSPLGPLVDSEWGVDESVKGWHCLAARIKKLGKAVIACGFDPDETFTHCGRVDAVARALLQPIPRSQWCSLADDGSFLEQPAEGHPAFTEQIHVSDVAAESRIAVREIATALRSNPSARILVLCAHEGTMGRFRAACARSGVAVVEHHSEALGESVLSGVCMHLSPLFANGELHGFTRQSLQRLLFSPAFSGGLCHADLFQELNDLRGGLIPEVRNVIDLPEDEAHPVRSSRRSLKEVLQLTRLSVATFAEWIDAFEMLANRTVGKLAAIGDDEADPARFAAGRIVVAAKLVAWKLRLVEEAAEAGTFHALADLITSLAPRNPQDAKVSAIRAAIRARGSERVTHDALSDVLSGSVDTGTIQSGVRVMACHEYDERTVDVLIVLDLHSKGLLAPPMPDSVLFAAEPAGGTRVHEAYGLPIPDGEVRERVVLIKKAVSRAHRSIAIASHRDSQGKAVVPPSDLGVHGAPSVFDHGLDHASVAIAENVRRAAITAGPHGDGEAATWLDVQIDAEWARAGQLFVGQLPPQPLDADDSCLHDYAAQDRRPDHCRAFLGDVGSAGNPAAPNRGTPGFGIPTGFSFSPSRVERFSGCMYRGWASSILRLEADRERDEDLGADEVGSIVHQILHRALFAEPPFAEAFVCADEASANGVRGRLLSRLREATQFVFDGAPEEIFGDGAVPPRVGQALDGLRQRYHSHWERYVQSRVVTVEQAQEDRRKALKPIKDFLDEVGTEIFPVDPLAPREAVGKAAFAALEALENRPSVDALQHGAFSEDLIARALAGLANTQRAPFQLGRAEHIAALLQQPDSRLVRLVKRIAERWTPRIAVGDRRPIEGELALDVGVELGESSVLPLRGRLDLLLRRAFEGAEALQGLEVLDYKLGSSGDVSPEDAFRSVIKPQLPLYAVAVESRGHDERVASVRIDKTKSGDTRQGGKGIHMISHPLPQFRERLGSVLAPGVLRGDFALLPHPEQCRVLRERAYCDFASACRLRALTSSVEPEGESNDGDA